MPSELSSVASSPQFKAHTQPTRWKRFNISLRPQSVRPRRSWRHMASHILRVLSSMHVLKSLVYYYNFDKIYQIIGFSQLPLRVNFRFFSENKSNLDVRATSRLDTKRCASYKLFLLAVPSLSLRPTVIKENKTKRD